VVALGIDTSTPAGSIGLAEGDSLQGEIRLAAGGHHQERLLRGVDALLDLLGIPIGSVGVIAVALGPGSFTGLRVGIATAKGLALARGIPAYGLSTLAAMALHFRSRGLPIAPVIDAGRREVYAALFRVEDGILRSIREEKAGPPEEFFSSLPREPILLCGDGVRRYRDRIPGDQGVERVLEAEGCFLGGTLARWGAEQLGRGSPWSLRELKPNYLRPADAEVGRTR
jgi:tRNA threonylcarbamoyladenosine biosynthesis protein TsaB